MFDILSRIIQRCPASGSIFVLAVDPFLKLLDIITEKAISRAFANGIGSIIPELRHLPKYRNAHNGFATISGLALKPKKSAFIPLGIELTPARHDKIKEPEIGL